MINGVSCLKQKMNDLYKYHQAVPVKTTDKAEEACKRLNLEIKHSVTRCIEESLPFELECDASDISIDAEKGLLPSFLGHCMAQNSNGHLKERKHVFSLKLFTTGSII